MDKERDILRGKLGNYAPDTERDLWSGIEAGIKPRRKRPVWIWMAVAAVLTLLIGIWLWPKEQATLPNHADSPSIEVPTKDSSQSPILQKAPTPTIAATPAEKSVEPIEEKKPAIPKTPKKPTTSPKTPNTPLQRKAPQRKLIEKPKPRPVPAKPKIPVQFANDTQEPIKKQFLADISPIEAVESQKVKGVVSEPTTTKKVVVIRRSKPKAAKPERRTYELNIGNTNLLRFSRKKRSSQHTQS